MSELETLAEHLGRELLNRGEWLATVAELEQRLTA
jgi:hypothetical protein